MGMNLVIDQLSSPLSLIEELKTKLPVSVTTLAGTGFCDYVWWGHDGHSITLERKTVQDLSGRVDDLEGQLKNALLTADEVILLIEGIMSPIEGATCLYNMKQDGNIFYRGRVISRPYSYYMGFLWRLDKLGISHFTTANEKGTASAIVEFVRASNKTEFTTFKRYIRKKPVIPVHNPQIEKLMGLGLGEKRATALIEKYGTVWNVLSREVDELCSVEGIGRKIAENLLKGVGKWN